MADISVKINGISVTCDNALTILEAAKTVGIDIPTLCHDDRTEHYASCGVCMAEVLGIPKLMRACSTTMQGGWEILTEGQRAVKSRTAALELLLSDHIGDCVAPCQTGCPAHTDCQGYVGLIANGQVPEALKLIMQKIPLPASIGRVCPHPCETECRRKLVEEPISIAFLKQYAADKITGSAYPKPDLSAPTGKNVAIIGGGPGGLSAAYYLKQSGHDVTIFDMMPKLGGMLRYGIPEYRLPKAVLDAEIEHIISLGVKTEVGMKIGRDITFDKLRADYDAVLIAIGAWTSSMTGCPGEELPGVVGGIDFLREWQGRSLAQRKVAVVGGGNTAMDAVRTAVRLGADEVYNIYRRTRAEMPADAVEIDEAEEEGVIFRNLTNPIAITGDGKVEAVKLQLMKLGEPDAKGRPRPVPIEGAEEVLPVDIVILAIGQGIDSTGFEGITLSRWGTIVADKTTFRTNIEGVFAAGDATNNGADIAVTAIAEAGQAAAVIDSYLYYTSTNIVTSFPSNLSPASLSSVAVSPDTASSSALHDKDFPGKSYHYLNRSIVSKGEVIPYTEPVLVEKTVTPDDFADREKLVRAKMPHQKPEVRRANFDEVNFGFSDAQAKAEALRCLECGCHDYYECKLINYANRYRTTGKKYAGAEHIAEKVDCGKFIKDPNKCILCGLCVRICEEQNGATAWGFIGRGFDTVIMPEMGNEMWTTKCDSCGQCVNACPTGALIEKVAAKPVPLDENFVRTVCPNCSLDCEMKLTFSGELILRCLPDDTENNQAALCEKGRFAPLNIPEKPKLSLRGKPASIDEIFAAIKDVKTGLLPEEIAIAVSEKLTNEQLEAAKSFATCLGTERIFCPTYSRSGFGTATGRDSSTVGLGAINISDTILVAGDLTKSPVAIYYLHTAARHGAQIIGADSVGIDDILSEKVAFSDIGISIFEHAKKPLIIFDQSGIDFDNAKKLGELANFTGAGTIQIKAHCNSQGVVTAGIIRSDDCSGVKLLFDIGGVGDYSGLSDELEAFIVQLTSEVQVSGKSADVVIPTGGFGEVSGTFTRTDASTATLKKAVCHKDSFDCVNILQKLLGNH